MGKLNSVKPVDAIVWKLIILTMYDFIYYVRAISNAKSVFMETVKIVWLQSNGTEYFDYYGLCS
jgi:hypothetical protein